MRKPVTSKGKANIVLIIATIGAALFAVAWAVFNIVKNLSETNVFAIINGNESVCCVSTRQEAEIAIRMCSDKISSSVGDDEYTGDISISLKKIFNPKTVSSETASELIFNSLFPGYVRCYAVVIDNTRVAYCNSYEEAENVIKELKNSALEALIEISPENDQIAFNNVFEIVSAFAGRARVLSLEEIRENVIGKDINQKASETIIDGTRVDSVNGMNASFGGGPVDYGVSRNYGAESNRIYDLSFGKTNIGVDFSRVTTVTYTEIINFDTEYIESKKLYVGETRVSSPGSYGTVRKTVMIKHNSDGSNSRQTLSSEILVPAQSEVILKGIKKYPSTKPTGSFIWPLDKYTVTSYFGEYRSGYDKKTGGHLGMDLGVNSGYPVMAADGGTVILAETVTSYGNLIKIQHEDGVVTYYAHLSEIDVEAGDRIYKGQIIGKVGMTGSATGPHLHFEVRINGKSVDPLKYLP